MAELMGIISEVNSKVSDSGRPTWWWKLEGDDTAYFMFSKSLWESVTVGMKVKMKLKAGTEGTSWPKVSAVEVVNPAPRPEVQTTLQPQKQPIPAQSSGQVPAPAKDVVMARMSAFRGLCELVAGTRWEPLEKMRWVFINTDLVTDYILTGSREWIDQLLQGDPQETMKTAASGPVDKTGRVASVTKSGGKSTSKHAGGG